jgi:hypothetical protein
LSAAYVSGADKNISIYIFDQNFNEHESIEWNQNIEKVLKP